LIDRGNPDVSWNADPRTAVAVYNTTGTGGTAGWFDVGGTSAGAPQFAAVIALANERRADRGRGLIGDQLQEFIYQIGLRGKDAYFNDIAQFGTGLLPDGDPCSPDDWPTVFVNPAFVGWDFATGYGSPNTQSFIPALAGEKFKLVNRSIDTHFRYTGEIDTPGRNLFSMQGTGSIRGYYTLTGQFGIARDPFGGSFIVLTDMFDATPDTTPEPIKLIRQGNTFYGVGLIFIDIDEPGVVVTGGPAQISGEIDAAGNIRGLVVSVLGEDDRTTIGPDNIVVRGSIRG
jgi:hypothetical protein